MLRIQRYILREFLGPTVLGLAIYTFLFLVKLLFELAELAIRKQLPMLLLGELLLMALPRLLATTFPLALLLGVLLGMARLSSDGEVTALRACGTSYLQMLPPVLLLGLAGMALVGYDALVLVPRATAGQRLLQAELLRAGDINRNLKPRVFYQEIRDVLLYADRIDPDGGLRDVLLVQKAPDGSQALTLARTARIEQDLDTGRLRFLLSRGETHLAAPGQPRRYERSLFVDKVVVQPPDEGLLEIAERMRSGGLPPGYRELPTPELIDGVRAPVGSPGGFSPRRWPRAAVELHRRFAVPAACVVFVLLAFPLGIVTRRGGRSSGFALSLGIILAYWLLMTGGENLAHGGAIHPAVAVWTPNVLTLLLAVILLAWLSRDRRLPEPVQRLLGRLRLPGWRVRWRRRALRLRARARRGAVGGGLFMGRLDQYVLHHYVRAFALVLASFYVVYFLADLRSLLDDISESEEIAYSLLASYFGIASPNMILSGLPLAALFAALLALGLLERNNEVNAMKAAGVSLYRVAAPVVLAALGLCGIHFLLSENVLPAATSRAAELRARIRGVQPSSTFGPRQWVFGTENRLYNFVLHRQAQSDYQGVAVYRLAVDRTSLLERIEARRARHEDGAWVLEDGWIRTFRDGGEEFRTFQSERFRLPEGPSYFAREARPPKQMTYARLSTTIATLRQAGYDVAELQVALHEKISMAAVPFVLVLLGLPFAFRVGRRGPLSGAGLALMLAIAYYICLAAFRQLGAVGWIPPLVAAWSANTLFAGVAFFKIVSLRT